MVNGTKAPTSKRLVNPARKASQGFAAVALIWSVASRDWVVGTVSVNLDRTPAAVGVRFGNRLRWELMTTMMARPDDFARTSAGGAIVGKLPGRAYSHLNAPENRYRLFKKHHRQMMHKLPKSCDCIVIE